MKRTPLKKQSKTTRAGWVRKLDKLVSEIVRERDGKCVVCGKREDLTCGHLFSRVNYSTRWDLGNCFCQCRSCNYSHEFNPYPFYRWYIKKYGMETWDALYLKHKQIHQFKTWQLEELFNQLKGK